MCDIQGIGESTDSAPASSAAVPAHLVTAIAADRVPAFIADAAASTLRLPVELAAAGGGWLVGTIEDAVVDGPGFLPPGEDLARAGIDLAAAFEADFARETERAITEFAVPLGTVAVELGTRALD